MAFKYIIQLAAILLCGYITNAFFETIYTSPWTCVTERIVPCIPEPCRCNELILPPKSVELPCGLGFSLAAKPVVANAYNQKILMNGGPNFDYSDAYIPISSPCACVKLATPVGQEIACLVKPVVL